MSNYTQQCEVCGKDLQGTGRPVHDECVGGAARVRFLNLNFDACRRENFKQVERIAQLEAKIAELERDVERLRKMAEDFSKLHTKGEQRIAELTALLREAPHTMACTYGVDGCICWKAKIRRRLSDARARKTDSV